MQVLNFADFARRKANAAQTDAVIQQAAAMPVVDRWASLHAEPVEPVAQKLQESQERDFFSDLQLRMAYPTYSFQHH